MNNPTGKQASGLEPRLAGLLCYAFWWISGIIFLVIEKEDKVVRFHAVQSIIVFGAITIAEIILVFIPFIGWILGYIVWLGAFVLWIICMLKAYQGQPFRLPIAGDIAAKQAGV
jgi:uncharacterized membrane protein